jgi:hypothetical protein
MSNKANARHNLHTTSYRVCVKIGGRYYHDPKQAARAWSQDASRTVMYNYQRRDLERYRARFNMVPSRYGSGFYEFSDDKGRSAHVKWEMDLYAQAYKKAFPIFKKLLVEV